MRMAIQKTGPYGFGLMYHVIHLSDDVPAINAWYQKVFDADVWWPTDGPNWSEIEDRYAALMAVSDLCIESMAPKQPANDRYPVGRFYLRHGSRFHSLGTLVDDIEGFAQHLLDHDVYIGLPGGGRMEEVPPDIYYFYPSPRSVGGLMVQITRNTDGAYSPAVATDPRLQDDWDTRALRWSEHPLGIRRFGYATMTVRDVDATKAIVEKLWQAVPVYDGVDEGRGVRSSFLQLGHLLIELASPLFGRRARGRTLRTVRRDALPAHVPRRRPRLGRGVPPHGRRALRANVGRGRHRRRRRLPRRQLRLQHRNVPRRPARLTPTPNWRQ